jgi:hypothetical protein
VELIWIPRGLPNGTLAAAFSSGVCALNILVDLVHNRACEVTPRSWGLREGCGHSVRLAAHAALLVNARTQRARVPRTAQLDMKISFDSSVNTFLVLDR